MKTTVSEFLYNNRTLLKTKTPETGNQISRVTHRPTKEPSVNYDPTDRIRLIYVSTDTWLLQDDLGLIYKVVEFKMNWFRDFKSTSEVTMVCSLFHRFNSNQFYRSLSKCFCISVYFRNDFDEILQTSPKHSEYGVIEVTFSWRLLFSWNVSRLTICLCLLLLLLLLSPLLLLLLLTHYIF